MNEKEARTLVTQRGWLTTQPTTFQEDLLSRCALRIWNDGEPIYELGAQPDGIYGLVSGSLSLMVAPHQPGPFFAYVARPGFWLGEAAHITDTTRRVGLNARGRVAMFHLPPRALKDLCAGDPQAAWRIAAITVSHLDLALSVVSNYMVRNPLKKVAGFLLTLTGWNAAPAPPWESIDITQSELADICQLSRKSINKVIGELEALGAIEHSRNVITIIDRRLLGRLTASE